MVWLKDVSFLADTVTGRAEGTLRLVEDLQALLAEVNPEEVAVVITAAPVDRRRAFIKWCEATADYTFVGDDGKEGAAMLEQVALAEVADQGATITPDALGAPAGEGRNQHPAARRGSAQAQHLCGRPRRTRGGGGVIEESHVEELTPNFAEGDFFEAAEAFSHGDLPRTLAALHRHFFSGGDARPVIAALQNRNRLLVQLRVLIDAGEVRIGSRGLDKAGFERAAAAYARHFGNATEKSSFNVFTQNFWYLNKWRVPRNCRRCGG